MEVRRNRVQRMKDHKKADCACAYIDCYRPNRRARHQLRIHSAAVVTASRYFHRRDRSLRRSPLDREQVFYVLLSIYFFSPFWLKRACSLRDNVALLQFNVRAGKTRTLYLIFLFFFSLEVFEVLKSLPISFAFLTRRRLW